MHILSAVGGICCVFMSFCLKTQVFQPVPQVVKGGEFENDIAEQRGLQCFSLI